MRSGGADLLASHLDPGWLGRYHCMDFELTNTPKYQREAQERRLDQVRETTNQPKENHVLITER